MGVTVALPSLPEAKNGILSATVGRGVRWS